jgi:hypothetical protein
MAKSRARLGRWRRGTASWWRSAMTSSSKAARPRQRQANQQKSSDRDASIRRDYGPPHKIARVVNAFGIFAMHNRQNRRCVSLREQEKDPLTEN